MKQKVRIALLLEHSSKIQTPLNVDVAKLKCTGEAIILYVRLRFLFSLHKTCVQ